MTDGTGKGQGESVGMAGTKADALTVSGSAAVVRPAAMPDLAVEHAHRARRPARAVAAEIREESAPARVRDVPRELAAEALAALAHSDD